MLARQEFHQECERRAAMSTVLTRAVGELAIALPALLAQAGTDERCAAEARDVLTVLSRTRRVHPLEPELVAAAGALAAALPQSPPATADSPVWSRPADVLHADRDDLIAFTRALLRATKAGCCLPRLPRPVPQLLDDAEAALGAALRAGDRELTARLLATWPLLGAPWTAPARCAFDDVLATAILGELPEGIDTCIAVALLCALALEHGRVPEPWVATETDRRVGLLLAAGEPVRDAALVVAAALRAAALAGDQARLRAVLAIAVSCGVSADAATAATIEQLCGLSAFSALAG